MNTFRLITLDPGHFHAALIQKEMYPEVSARATVYAPLGPDLISHLERVARFNLRAEKPTAWELDVHAAPDFLERMAADRPGNVVVLSGRNRRKIDLIEAAIAAGLNVLADKPWIISAADLPRLEAVLQRAEDRGLVAYDIMTERYEITSMLQRELVNDSEIFGEAEAGTVADPGVYMESVHHIMKMVAGVPNLRPAWFFDVEEQGEALADVGTHLVDLTQWTLFPGSALDWRSEIQLVAAKRWPTWMTPEQFSRVTGQSRAEDLDYYCNTQVDYTIRNIHVKMDVIWRYEAPEGTGDTYLASFRGTKSSIEIRQGADEKYRPELYVVPKSVGVKDAVKKKVESLQAAWPGVEMKDRCAALLIHIPDRYRVGHEAHFAQVTRQFFEYLKSPSTMPPEEKPNMAAKYHVSTGGVELSHKS